MRGYGGSYAMQKLFRVTRQSSNAALQSAFAKRKPSPRKLEPHEVVAKLKARATRIHKGEEEAT